MSGVLIRCLWANYAPGKVSCRVTCWKLKWICSLLESLSSNEVKCSTSSLLISMSNNKFIISFKTFSARKCQNKWNIDIYVSWPSSWNLGDLNSARKYLHHATVFTFIDLSALLGVFSILVKGNDVKAGDMLLSTLKGVLVFLPLIWQSLMFEGITGD